jgi:hypothetical protein
VGGPTDAQELPSKGLVVGVDRSADITPARVAALA